MVLQVYLRHIFNELLFENLPFKAYFYSVISTGLPFMINVTLPDDKLNYTHRIGRVGRAERMGLAISLVAQMPEKVWVHGQWCKSRGKNCYNTRLTDRGGCCIYYNEPVLLAEIEEHLGVTIPQAETDMIVKADEFDGKVVYGQKRKEIGSIYELSLIHI